MKPSEPSRGRFPAACVYRECAAQALGVQGTILLASEVDIGHSTASAPANLEPSPKKNAVAHEVRVIVTGARPGKSPGDRELFTEKTTSALVFENGGVICLSAAVIPGQLLFLTNQESNREVVAQVTHKRNNRPTSCYVELQFTEPSPGFWGIDFPKLPERPQADAKQVETAELVQSAETTADEPETPAPFPDVHQVERLKKEVEALRQQLECLQESQHAAGPSAVAVSQSDPVPEAPKVPRAASPIAQLPPVVISSKPPATLAPTAASPAALTRRRVTGSEKSIAEEDLLPKPVLDFEQANLEARRSGPSAGGVPSGRGSRTIRLGLLSAALLLVATGAAWNMHWLPGLPSVKSLHPSMPANLGHGPNSVQAVSSVSPKTLEPHPDSGSTKQISESPTIQLGSPSRESLTAGAPPGAAPKPEPVALVSVSEEREAPPSVVEKPAPAVSAPKRIFLRSSNKTEPVSASSPPDTSGYSPPKLIHSVRAAASPEALRGFVTGNVTVDAAVDSTGRVKTATVLSGPATLRKAAVDAVKQYRYQPATQDGKPVPAHLKVTIQFWFEP